MRKVVVIGASGFVGTHVCREFEARGVDVVRATAPRLSTVSADAIESEIENFPEEFMLTAEWRGATALVNAAGDPDASSMDIEALNAANGMLPGLLGRLATEVGIPRFVHISSAVVQGRRTLLDDSNEFDAFSPYAKSKVLGEELARRYGPSETVSFRPPSVHDPSRRVTQLTARIAASAFSTVAAPGTQHTPQALIGNVAAAVAEIALNEAVPPSVVIHPWEGLTCSSLLAVLGGRQPTRLPMTVAKSICAVLRATGRLIPGVLANARRIEMVWFGQEQAESWLTTVGFELPIGFEGWEDLRERLSQQTERCLP